MLKKEEILELFHQSGAVLNGHFQLTSGRHADTYMQCAKLFENAVISEKLCKATAELFKDVKIDFVVSPAIGGIIMGYELSRHLKVKNFFAERVDGKMTLRRGFSLPKGSKVIVCEDVVTTGGSAKEVVELIKELGSVVVAVTSIVDRSNGKVEFGTLFRALLPIDVKSYEPQECPICKTDVPLYKPGSRT
ncbi:MAG: orotate phosphoribosyltransferase [Firmicutes bacterium]|nr:orotate phosphoribosyltransferase [Bacillota bacterium]